MSHILVLIHLLAFHCESDYSFSKHKKMLRVWWYFFVVSLNPIKRFDLETCQLDSFPYSSFELNRVRVDPKWIIQFNGSKYNLDDQ
jgi:hypothetical protein